MRKLKEIVRFGTDFRAKQGQICWPPERKKGIQKDP